MHNGNIKGSKNKSVNALESKNKQQCKNTSISFPQMNCYFLHHFVFTKGHPNQLDILILVITIHCILLICNLDKALLFCTNRITNAFLRNHISPKQASALNERHTLANWPGKQDSERKKQQNFCLLDKSFLSTYKYFSRGLADFFQRCIPLQQLHFIQVQIIKQLQSHQVNREPQIQTTTT